MPLQFQLQPVAVVEKLTGKLGGSTHKLEVGAVEKLPRKLFVPPQPPLIGEATQAVEQLAELE